MKSWNRLQKVVDLKSGSALGLITLSFCWALLHGHDIGTGSGMALSALYAGFAATKIKGRGPDAPEAK